MPKMEKNKAIEILKNLIGEVDSLIPKSRFCSVYTKWQRNAEVAIKNIFGKDSEHLNEFKNIINGPGIFTSSTTDSVFKEGYRKGLEEHRAILQSMIREIDEYWENEVDEVELIRETFWAMLHPEVVRVARSRFESRHYADAVEAILKEINITVKRMVIEKTGKEYDGSHLMQKAFSTSDPTITLADLTMETGRNTQVGYQQLFAGAMIGIRNPKAHENIEIDEIRAIHFLFLASLLMNKIDERI